MLSRLLRAAGATLVALATLVAVPVASAADVTTSGVTVTVNQTIPAITRGVAYSHQVTATAAPAYGGTYAYQIIAGALPSGLTISSSGLISGMTCDATGSAWTAGFRVTLNSAPSTVHDFTGANAFNSGINNAGGGGNRCQFTFTGATPNGTVGTAYSTDIDVTGATNPVTWTIASGSLPPGLTLATGTGVISGTPTTAGTYAFTLLVVDAGGKNGVGHFSITIAAAPPVVLNVLPSLLPNGQTTVGYLQAISTANGTAPFSFTISAGTLPPGLSLPSGGLLNGTPTVAGTYNFTVRATDALGNTGTRAYTVVIAGSSTLTLAPATVPNGTRSAAYSQAISASGGTAPYAYSITAGALPAGLTLSATGTLSGTPTATGALDRKSVV